MALKSITLEHLIDLISGAKDSQTKVCLLIGAGVSKSAGVGLAGDFVDRIKTRYPQVYKAACAAAGSDAVPSYAQCMDALMPAHQVKLVREDIDKAKINWAHIGIARLEQGKIVESILTPNFDPLASRACALFNRFPAIYDLAGLRDDSSNHLEFDPSFVTGSAIFHLHGQHTGFLLLNTEAKLKAQAERIQPVLEAVMRGKPVIIAGYSGANDPLVEKIAALAPFNHGLFWICHGDADPAPNVRDTLLSLPNCYVLKNLPADRFFTDLANGLDLGATTFLHDPFAHMLQVLETIECYEESKGSPQDALLDRARARLTKAASDGTGDQTPSKITELLSAGRYEEALRHAETSTAVLTDEEREDAAWAAIELANKLGDQALAKSGVEADTLFDQAYEKYDVALRILPTANAAFYGWGITLGDQARSKPDDEAHALLAEAGEKYAAALAINPDMHEALNNWGNALSEQAARSTPERAIAIFAESGEKYAAAIAIKPDKPDTMFNWGNVLADQARLETEDRSDALFATASEKYEAALALRPDMPDTLNNWGAALADQAKRKSGKNADTLYAKAFNKFSAALDIQPDKANALNNWGLAIFEQAKKKPDKESDKLFLQANEKFASALDIKPDMHEAFNNWGNALSERAKRKKGEEADKLFESAFEKYAAAIAIKPDKYEAFNNWGNAYGNKAKIKSSQEAESLFKNAYELYEKSVSINPYKHQALRNWGITLRDHAKLKSGAEAEKLSTEAEAKFALAQKLMAGGPRHPKLDLP